MRKPYKWQANWRSPLSKPGDYIQNTKQLIINPSGWIEVIELEQSKETPWCIDVTFSVSELGKILGERQGWLGDVWGPGATAIYQIPLFSHYYG